MIAQHGNSLYLTFREDMQVVVCPLIGVHRHVERVAVAMRDGIDLEVLLRPTDIIELRLLRVDAAPAIVGGIEGA